MVELGMDEIAQSQLGCYNKIPQTRWLKKYKLISDNSGGRVKVKVLADLVPGEDPLGLQTAAFLLYSHMVERSFLFCLLQGH